MALSCCWHTQLASRVIFQRHHLETQSSLDGSTAFYQPTSSLAFESSSIRHIALTTGKKIVARPGSAAASHPRLCFSDRRRFPHSNNHTGRFMAARIYTTPTSVQVCALSRAWSRMRICSSMSSVNMSANAKSMRPGHSQLCSAGWSSSNAGTVMQCHPIVLGYVTHSHIGTVKTRNADTRPPRREKTRSGDPTVMVMMMVIVLVMVTGPRGQHQASLA